MERETKSRLAGTGIAATLLDAAKQFTEKFDCLLVPPLARNQLEAVCTDLAKSAGAEAVSLFLVSLDDPSCVEIKASVGYKGLYDTRKYYFRDFRTFLTSYVAYHGTVVEGLSKELEEDRTIPFSGACRLYLLSGETSNVLAIPILLHRDRCLGVLKIENLARIPSGDTGTLAVCIALLLAVAYQGGVQAQLWADTAALLDSAPSGNSLLDSMASLLKRYVRCECVSFFTKAKNEDDAFVLKFGGGVGYKEPYRHHVYAYNDSPEDCTSFTSFVAATRAAACFTQAELAQLQEAKRVPYTGACAKNIESATFRNILALPIQRNHECLGVMKLENKKPEHEAFDSYDQRLCEHFVNAYVLKVLDAKPGHAYGPSVYSRHDLRLLYEECGSRESLKGLDRLESIKIVRECQLKHPKFLTSDLCAEYLGMTRVTYYSWIKKLPEKYRPQASRRSARRRSQSD